MGGFFRKFSLVQQGLRYKLLIAFALMAIIPLLVMTYLVSTYILTQEEISLSQISIIVLVSVIIAWLGLVLAKNLVEPVIDMSIEAKIIASGDFERKIRVTTEDEIGELGTSINLLARRIKDNVQELRDYGEKTREINLEIQKKMLALSNLLQIGDLISASADLDKILDTVLEKLAHFYDSGFAVVYLPKKKPDEFAMRAYSNLRDSELLDVTVKLGEGFLGEVALKRKTIAIDSSTPRNSVEYKFKNKYKLANVVIIPLYTGKITGGLILIGNNIKEFTYTNEDIDTIKVFSKQLSIAVESDMLLKKAQMLAIKDDLTGIYNKNFIMPRLNEEIERAIRYQRPCSFIIVNIDNFKEYRNKRGQLASENTLKEVAGVLTKRLGPIDKAARMGDDVFALLLPEKNKKTAFDIAEEIRQGVEKLRFSNDESDRVTVSVGVSENPLDGSTSEGLFNKATAFVKKAKIGGKNKVI